MYYLPRNVLTTNTEAVFSNVPSVSVCLCVFVQLPNMRTIVHNVCAEFVDDDGESDGVAMICSISTSRFACVSVCEEAHHNRRQ